MKKVFLLGALALGLMSFSTSSEASLLDCVEFANEVEAGYTDGGCDVDVYNMAYSFCIDELGGYPTYD